MLKLPKISHLIAGTALAAAVIIPVAASAQMMRHGFSFHRKGPASATSTAMTRPMGHRGPFGAFHGNRGVAGTVASISGSTMTVTAKDGTVYTVDASKATLMERPNDGLTLANIQTGDKVMVNGTVTGTTVAATRISDLSFNGRNIFSGKVTAVDGSTLTLSSMKETTYTIDAGNASITQGMMNSTTTIAVSAIQVNDRLNVVGSLNGSTITATVIHDMKMPAFHGKPGFGPRGWGRR